MALEKTNRHSLFPLLRRKTLFRPLVESLEPRLALAAFTVGTTADTAAVNLVTGQDSAGHISLRSAIMAANNLGGSNTVALPTGNYNLTIAGTDEDKSRDSHANFVARRFRFPFRDVNASNEEP